MQSASLQRKSPFSPSAATKRLEVGHGVQFSETLVKVLQKVAALEVRGETLSGSDLSIPLEVF